MVLDFAMPTNINAILFSQTRGLAQNETMSSIFWCYIFCIISVYSYVFIIIKMGFLL